MAISSLFILDVKGRVIINRDYRGDVSPKCAERFMAKLTELEGDSKLTPIIYDDAGISYVYLTVRTMQGRTWACMPMHAHAPASAHVLH